jgi:hypothetical protein
MKTKFVDQSQRESLLHDRRPVQPDGLVACGFLCLRIADSTASVTKV